MQGTVTSGLNNSAAFVPEIEDLVVEELGFDPYPGTLNLAGVDGLETLSVRTIEDPTLGFDNCRGVRFQPCSIAGVRAGVVRPLVEGYPTDKTEVLAPVALRGLFDLSDGDRLSISPHDDLEAPGGPGVESAALDEFDAVVFDLDLTLVELAVPWEDVRADLVDRLSEFLPRESLSDADASLRGLAREHGVWDEFVTVVGRYELAGVADAAPLPLLRVLPTLECPVGICTRNGEAAARNVLERFDVADAVDVVVARETVDEQKPHPRPLRHCLERVGVRPGDAVFVGDDPSDRTTAERAGTSFLDPARICDGY